MTHRRRPVLAALAAALGLMAPLLAAPHAQEAATLIQARIDDRPVRVVVDQAQKRVLVSMAGGERRLVDLARGEVYVIGRDGAAHRFRADRLTAIPAAFRLDPWGPGPFTAGYPTTYHVVKAGERICAEVLVSRWRDDFMADAMHALDLLQRADAAAGRGAAANADLCAEPPFAAYAAAGWPVMAGLIDRALFETISIEFGYAPTQGELALPTRFKDALADS